MGLLSFVKAAGKKLLGQDEETGVEAQATQAAGAEGVQVKDMAALREELRQRKLEAAMAQQVADLGLEAENLEINVNGDTVTVAGSVATQEIREKIALALGNVDGVAQVDDHLEVTNPEPEATFYTVVSGDNLSKIAKAHYGKSSKYMVIFEANKPMLEDPDKIYPGQVLRIPALED